MSSSRLRVGGKPVAAGIFNVRKVNPTAERPLHTQDRVGWEITLITRTNNRVEDEANEIHEFDTGLNIEISKGSYLEIVPHHQLIMHGYMLPGPIIIDSSHVGNITIPLFKFREGGDLELPFTAVLAFTHTEESTPIQLAQNNDSNKNYYGQQNGQPQFGSGVSYPQGMQNRGRPSAQPMRGGNHMY